MRGTSDKRRATGTDPEARRAGHKRRAVELLGGACSECGYDKCLNALHFHHLDPSKKSFGIGTRISHYSWKRIEGEVSKCVLLCANCHFERHAVEWEPLNPTGRNIACDA